MYQKLSTVLFCLNTCRLSWGRKILLCVEGAFAFSSLGSIAHKLGARLRMSQSASYYDAFGDAQMGSIPKLRMNSLSKTPSEWFPPRHASIG